MGISAYLKNLREKIGHDPVMQPAVCAVVVNAAGEVLLCRQTDDGRWHTIGGAIDPHEEPAAAAEREAFEETGLRVRAERVAAVYAGPDTTYANGDRVWYVTMAFRCAAPAGAPRQADDETYEVRYFAPDCLPDLGAHDRHAIRCALHPQAAAHFRATGDSQT